MTIKREIAGFRFAETHRGDTLPAIALRELGDGARWPELVAFNSLLPPFITDDPTQAKSGVILTGGLIRIPAATQASTVTQDGDAVFLADLQLQGGRLAADGGDFAVVSGLPNLKQALGNALDTERGELSFHPQYGSLLRRIIGTVNGPTAALLAGRYAKATILADDRIARVTDATATVVGDRVSVDVTAEPVVGRAVTISQEL